MKQIKKNVKAIIFDMDGTILQTEHIWNQATLDLLAKRGIVHLSTEQQEFLTALSGIGLTQSAEVLKKEFSLLDTIDNLVEDTKFFANKLFETEIKFIEGFETFHQKLRTNFIPTSIATNADSTSLLHLNKKMNLHSFFGENIYSIDVVGNRAKPHPDIFLHAADKLKAKPHECVVFEDSLFGFQAAKAAGMICIAIKNSINGKNLNLVHCAIDSYHEAEKALLVLPFSK